MGVLSIDLRLGRWQDVLADVECDAIITDPPYGARTHSGQRHGRFDRSGESDGGRVIAVRGLPYEGWTHDDVGEFVESWEPRCRGWFVAHTSHDLCPVWEKALSGRGRYVFAPIACVQPAMNVRLAGDGPANWAVWMMVSRPRTMKAWGALPGAYVTPPGYRNGQAIPGGKPIALMRAIVSDYTRPGDLVCDPCAGGATTLIAASGLGRRAVGAEMDPETYAKARDRIRRGVQLDMLEGSTP